MKRWSLVLISVLMILAVLGATACQPKDTKLVVGTSADYEPFEFIAEDGGARQFDVRLMEEIAKRLDRQWQDIAFDGLIGSLQSDRLMPSLQRCRYAQREEQVDFTATLPSARMRSSSPRVQEDRDCHRRGYGRVCCRRSDGRSGRMDRC